MPLRAKGNTADHVELAALIAKSGLKYSRFARCMGVPPSTLHGYLSGSRPVPSVAIGAAKWTLLCLGFSVEIDRAGIAQLLPANARNQRL